MLYAYVVVNIVHPSGADGASDMFKCLYKNFAICTYYFKQDDFDRSPAPYYLFILSGIYQAVAVNERSDRVYSCRFARVRTSGRVAGRSSWKGVGVIQGKRSPGTE